MQIHDRLPFRLLSAVYDHSTFCALSTWVDDIREAAAKALGAMRSQSAVGPLTSALKDNSEDLRKAAAKALCRIRRPKAADDLTAALQDILKSVRKRAEKALKKIKK